MPEPTPLRFGEMNVPGIVVRGFQVVDAPLQRSTFKLPGLNSTRVITLGLGERPIVVPMCVHSPTFRRYADVQAFMRRLEAFKGKGEQIDLVVPLMDGPQRFEKCYYSDCELMYPEMGILEDMFGTLGSGSAASRWFVDLRLIFMQVQPAR